MWLFIINFYAFVHKQGRSTFFIKKSYIFKKFRWKKQLNLEDFMKTFYKVYEILDITGFTEMMDVQKAYRKISVEGCVWLPKLRSPLKMGLIRSVIVACPTGSVSKSMGITKQS